MASFAERSRKVQVTILASEWGSIKGGLTTINRELAIQLAKCPEVEITLFLPKCSQEEKKLALQHNVTIIEATRRPGLEELEWLLFPPENLQIDVIVGHGVKLGKQAQIIKESKKCKWLQVVHTDPEELGMFKKSSNPISKGEEEHKTEVELCEMADVVVGVGPKLSEAFRSYLRGCQKDQSVVDLTPGVFEEFLSVRQVVEERKQRSVLVFGRGDVEDFEVKGLDIAGKAVAALKDTRLVFVGASVGKHEEIAKRLTGYGVPASRLRVKGFIEDRESLRRLFQQVDLVIMPSRTEGFGLAGLEALSAGLPVLVSHNSGFGEALCSVPFGSSFVVNSEYPTDWTAAISKIWAKDRKSRLEEVETLRDSYDKKYNWAKQIKDLSHKMISWTNVDFSNVQSFSETIGGTVVSSHLASQGTQGTTKTHADVDSTQYTATKGRSNYSRLCCLLISLGSKALRETFDRIIPPQSLQRVLKRNPAHSKLQSRRKEGILNSVQWNKLYPTTPSEVSSAGFDIPLLMVLLRTICDLSPPAAGWDAPPLPEDLSRESDIARLKYFFNAVSSHAEEGFDSDAVFRSYWQQIHDTLVRLGGADYEDVIEQMRCQEMDVLSKEHFSELLKLWRKVEDNIKDKLNELESAEALKMAEGGSPKSPKWEKTRSERRHWPYPRSNSEPIIIRPPADVDETSYDFINYITGFGGYGNRQQDSAPLNDSNSSLEDCDLDSITPTIPPYPPNGHVASNSMLDHDAQALLQHFLEANYNSCGLMKSWWGGVVIPDEPPASSSTSTHLNMDNGLIVSSGIELDDLGRTVTIPCMDDMSRSSFSKASKSPSDNCDFLAHIRVFYGKLEVLFIETRLTESERIIRLFYGSPIAPELLQMDLYSKLYGPPGAKQIKLPEVESTCPETKKVMSYLERGLLLEVTEDYDILATRLALTRVFYSNGRQPATKLQREKQTKVFDYTGKFIPTLRESRNGNCEYPAYDVTFYLGRSNSSLVSIVVTHIKARTNLSNQVQQARSFCQNRIGTTS